MFVALNLFAQNHSIKGIVKDENGFYLKGVEIFVDSQHTSFITNNKGYFEIETYKDTNLLTFHLESYSELKRAVITSQSKELQITLKKDASEMETVEIIYKNDKDKGKEIMKKVIEKRPFYQSFLDEYKCNIYTITTLTTNVYDSIKKDSVVGHKSLGISEWESTSYHKNNQFKDEFIAVNEHIQNEEAKQYEGNSYSINVGADIGDQKNTLVTQYEDNSDPYFFVKGINQVHFSIYDNLIISKKISYNPIISPLAYNAFVYYSFFYDFNFIDSNNQLVHKIRVEPKLKYEAVLIGDLYVVDGAWCVKSYNLKMNPNVTNYFESMQINANYNHKDSYVVPSYKEFIYQIKDGKNTIKGISRINQSNYSFKVEDTPKRFWLEIATYKDDAFDKDSSYWEATRGFKLNKFELDSIFINKIVL